jgi:hypothetical protein
MNSHATSSIAKCGKESANLVEERAVDREPRNEGVTRDERIYFGRRGLTTIGGGTGVGARTPARQLAGGQRYKNGMRTYIGVIRVC